mgnify:CR=1 FL=1
MLDLFATLFSTRLPLFSVPLPNVLALAGDSFSLLPRVLRKAEEVSPRMILLAPLWTSQPGFPDLTRLALDGPLTLALGPRALVQPLSGIPPGNPGVLCLTAWLLCTGL